MDPQALLPRWLVGVGGGRARALGAPARVVHRAYCLEVECRHLAWRTDARRVGG